MQLISQKTKAIMEECKIRAKDQGLQFDKETLEFVISNHEMTSLSAKNMIPSLYDYWVHDVDKTKSSRSYKLYPSNPYETVINTRPAISFYNDNNHDWLNVMIFYHVLGHIDFFQNNIFYERTHQGDFWAKALADKKVIKQLRLDLGERSRFVDYVIECARSLDNVVGFFRSLDPYSGSERFVFGEKLNYFFNDFLPKRLKEQTNKTKELMDRYNNLLKKCGPDNVEMIFFDSLVGDFPEFEEKYKKYLLHKSTKNEDVLEYLLNHSLLFRDANNAWMKDVINIVRDTSLYFFPQKFTKIMNEGWASFWHQRLFILDDRIRGHEVDYAKLNSGVMRMPRLGLNPYGLGCCLFEFIENMANKGRFSFDYQYCDDAIERKKFDDKSGKGLDKIFDIRRHKCDTTFINYLSEKDYQDFCNQHKLMVVAKRIDYDRAREVYYVKSRKGEDHRQMVFNALLNDPIIEVNRKKTRKGILALNQKFEAKPLDESNIPTMLFYLSHLWGGDTIQLFSYRLVPQSRDKLAVIGRESLDEHMVIRIKHQWRKGKYTKEEVQNE